MRTELKVLRIKKQLTQKEFADRTGVSLATYNLIENGTRQGNVEFWQTLQKEFNIEDAQMWQLQQNID